MSWTHVVMRGRRSRSRSRTKNKGKGRRASSFAMPSLKISSRTRNGPALPAEEGKSPALDARRSPLTHTTAQPASERKKLQSGWLRSAERRAYSAPSFFVDPSAVRFTFECIDYEMEDKQMPRSESLPSPKKPSATHFLRSFTSLHFIFCFVSFTLFF